MAASVDSTDETGRLRDDLSAQIRQWAVVSQTAGSGQSGSLGFCNSRLKVHDASCSLPDDKSSSMLQKNQSFRFVFHWQ